MVEKSFVASSKFTLDCFPVSGEFKEVGEELVDSEDLLDAVYRTYIPLISRGGWSTLDQSSNLQIEDIGQAYIGGFYIPCCRRVVFTGQVDLTNDRLSDHAAVVFHTKQFSPTFISVRKAKAPRGMIQFPNSTSYAATFIYEAETVGRIGKRIAPEALSAWSFWFSVLRDGRAIPLFDLQHDNAGKLSSIRAAACQSAVAALNLDADSNHLWTVRTEENLLAVVKTPLRLGVGEEHVKSLFYAREMPITETGRKRPILHWVAAHHRRIKEGIDVDISRHLRGIDRFEMDGFNFEITNPRKKPK